MIDISIVLATTLAIIMAELGDKTQLAAIALSSCGKPSKVFLGCFTGFVAVNFITIFIGNFIATTLPTIAIRIVSALAFLVFGILMLKEEKFELKDENSGIIASFAMIVSMEVGDKTNLAVLALSAYFQKQVEVLIGTILSSFLLMASASILGSLIRKKLSFRKIRFASAILFILISIYMLFEVFAR